MHLRHRHIGLEGIPPLAPGSCFTFTFDLESRRRTKTQNQLYPCRHFTGTNHIAVSALRRALIGPTSIASIEESSAMLVYTVIQAETAFGKWFDHVSIDIQPSESNTGSQIPGPVAVSFSNCDPANRILAAMGRPRASWLRELLYTR